MLTAIDIHDGVVSLKELKLALSANFKDLVTISLATRKTPEDHVKFSYKNIHYNGHRVLREGREWAIMSFASRIGSKNDLGLRMM